MKANKVSFAKMEEAQTNTKATAVNNGSDWTATDRNFLEAHMFISSIESIAIALGRTAYSVETILTKDPEFLKLRKEHGDVPETKIVHKKVEEKQYFVSSDVDTLFGTGD